MPSFSGDLGLILAYLIPGFIALWAIKRWIKPLEKWFIRVNNTEKSAVEVWLLIGLSLSLGMFLSLVRATVIDRSFAVNAPLVDTHTTPAYAAVPRQDPSYIALSNQGLRESFLLAESRDKRPYQFYGNMIISIILATISLASTINPKSQGHPKWRLAFLFAGCIFAITLLYPAARISHYRYMTAIININSFSQSIKP